MTIFRGQVLRDHVVNSVEISQLLMILENAVEMAWHPKSLVLQGFLGNPLNCGAV
jgi:hypothetical protein